MAPTMLRGEFLVWALVCGLVGCGSGGLRRGTGGVGGGAAHGGMTVDAAGVAAGGADASGEATDGPAGTLDTPLGGFGSGGLGRGGSGGSLVSGGTSSSGQTTGGALSTGTFGGGRRAEDAGIAAGTTGGVGTGGSPLVTGGTSGTGTAGASGTGSADFARFEVSPPTNLDLGTLAPGVSFQQSITITALVALSDLKVWASGDELSIDASATTCTANVAQGSSCTVAFTFVAPTIGWKRGIVGIKAGGDYGQVVNIEITATVSRANELAITPKAPPSFACIYGKTSPTVAFTVTNLAGVDSGTITSTLVGGDARDFAIAESDSTTLAPQAACKVQVVCKPALSASADTRYAVLSVTDGQTLLSVRLSAEVTF